MLGVTGGAIPLTQQRGWRSSRGEPQRSVQVQCGTSGSSEELLPLPPLEREHWANCTVGQFWCLLGILTNLSEIFAI